ncbi:cupin domain-containing protein [Burkholderia plantarii]|uniref:cupin domain-containing protein n=1 Tax=Burkholderia plantarii TaxID=41899 RepID=UPI00272B894E|nr:cupin domain-containing protein [Burkholderia plantarii]WLE61157.1 cupin domain-containing protein [Burkholderia plantarii]
MSNAIDLAQAVQVSDQVGTYRRIVTGSDENGKSYIVSDAKCANVQAIMGMPEFATTELWKTSETPVQLSEEAADPASGPVVLPPPVRGSVFRVVEFPPDSAIKAKFPVAGKEHLMHRTPSIDYVYVISGEIHAVLDKQETLMRAGDVMIQRGTNHDWINRTAEPCRVLFVLIGATLP